MIEILDIDKSYYQVLENINSTYLLKMNNNFYYFKPLNQNSICNELFVGELLKEYKIPHVTYKEAIFKGKHGVISESFSKDATFINSSTLIKPYINDYFSYEPNSIDLLFEAVNNKYHDKKFTKSFMDNFIKTYIIYAIIGNTDFNITNYGLLEENGKPELAPAFDYECSFDIRTNMLINSSLDQYYYKIPENILTFLSISDEDTIKVFDDIFASLDIEKLDRIALSLKKKGITLSKYYLPYIKEILIKNKAAISERRKEKTR